MPTRSLNARVWAEIDLRAIRDNARKFKKRLGEAALMGVLKADAYGHGLVAVARALRGVAGVFAVSNLEEAFRLRDAGLSERILLLYPLFKDETDAALGARVEATINSIEDARRMRDAATERGASATVHIAVNTGMNRYGVAPDELRPLYEFVRDCPRLRLAGIWTHFANASDPKSAFPREQFEAFTNATDSLKLPKHLLHAANTGATLNYPAMILGGARIGIGLYGAYPSEEASREIVVTPALTWKSRVIRIGLLKAGDTVSYGRAFTAKENMRVATLPVGYSDGYRRALSDRGHALIRGESAAVLGNITMNGLVCDISNIPDATVGDEATLIGADGERTVTADDHARWSDTIPYEILTGIAARVTRIYQNEGDT